MKCTYTVDPVTRYVHISYPVPMSAPEEIFVVCRVIRDGEALIPGVLPYVSDTAYAFPYLSFFILAKMPNPHRCIN
mgnify:CR=1 FL=1